MAGIGPRTRNQLARLSTVWRQGEHIIVTGATGSGKTVLARSLDDIRLAKGGHVVVLVGKLTPDATITNEYKGWKRWKEWKRAPSPDDKRILLWPDVERERTILSKRALQREVFREAFDRLSDVGKWTVHIDEGLYTCAPTFLNLGDELAMLHAMGRSSKLTLITLAQRPSHIPLIIYSSAAHAFMGRTREKVDNKRLSELGGRVNARELSASIDSLGRHDFVWVPVAPDWPTESVNTRR